MLHTTNNNKNKHPHNRQHKTQTKPFKASCYAVYTHNLSANVNDFIVENNAIKMWKTLR